MTTFLDIIILWLIAGTITVALLSMKDYKIYRVFLCLPFIVWYVFLFLGGPVYGIIQLIKLITKDRKILKQDKNWENIKRTK